MTIGIVVSTRDEREIFFEAFGGPVMHNLGTGAYEIIQWKLNDKGEDKFVYLIVSGTGEVAAASATQYLIDTFVVDEIVNYGVTDPAVLLTCRRNSIPVTIIRATPDNGSTVDGSQEALEARIKTIKKYI